MELKMGEMARGGRRSCLWLALACVMLHVTSTVVCAATSSVRDPLLLVVGNVTPSSARILYDRLPDSTSAFHVRVFGSVEAEPRAATVYTVDQQVQVSVETLGDEDARPRVLQLQSLRPGRQYVVQFHIHDPGELRDPSALSEEMLLKTDTATARFRTQRVDTTKGENSGDRVLVVSCDRYVDDHDDVLWERMAQDIDAHADKTATATYFGMAHLGDQIYADAGASSIPVVPLPLQEMADLARKRARFAAILAQFRAIYRETFGRPAAQRVLRVGAHWMLPDDHEILNNFNYWLVRRAFQGARDPTLSEAKREEMLARTLHYRAGLQAYYEFQYQLQRDFPWRSVDFLEDPLDEIARSHPAHFAVEVQHLKLFFLDVRFERSFFKAEQDDDLSKLVSGEQKQGLVQRMQRWSEQDGSAVVVLASMPLFFQSALSAAITFAVEHETYPGMAEQRQGLEELFQLFQRYSEPQRPGSLSPPPLRLLVGGDVHMMAHSRVCSTQDASPTCMDQLITSGVTNGSTSIQDAKLIPFYFLITKLTPLFETLLGWAWNLPLLSSVLPQRSPWKIQYDRVYLGRNYGVLELASDGVFTWNETVVEPYDHDYQQRIQEVVFDAATPPVLFSIVLLATFLSMVVAFRVVSAVLRLRGAPKRSHTAKTTKTQ